MSVYVLIRVPKCGSSSLRKMFSKALPHSSSFYISNANHELLNESNPSITEGLRVKKITLKVYGRDIGFSVLNLYGKKQIKT